VVRNPGSRYIYILRGITPTDSEPLQWDLPKVGIGEPADDGKRYQLLMVHTDGDLTRDFNDRDKQNDPHLRRRELPANARIADQVTVLRVPGAPRC
jgi:hypothetical protein